MLVPSPSQAPNESRFTMHNPCNFPVEVFSLDFDKQYLEEESILQVGGGGWACSPAARMRPPLAG